MADLTSSSIVESAVIEASHITTLYDTLTGTATYDNIDIAGSASYATTSSYAVTASYAENVTTSSQETTEITIKNVHTSTIAKGTPCFITASGASGNIAGVIPADAQSASLMPAGVISKEELAVGAEGAGVVIGYINGVDTSAFASGDNIYVAVGGGYANVKPTGSSNLIQKLGNVEKVDASNGSGVILGAGRTNDLPNITPGYFWVGDTDGVPEAVATSSITVGSSAKAVTLVTTTLTSGSATTGSAFLNLIAVAGNTGAGSEENYEFVQLANKTLGQDVFINVSAVSSSATETVSVVRYSSDGASGVITVASNGADVDFHLTAFYS